MNFLVFCIFSFHVFVDALYNGEYRQVKDYPFMAQIYNKFENHEENFCGATILSEYWLISAAHCCGYEDLIKSQVRTGSSSTLEKGVLIDIEKFLVHGDYSPNFAYDNDIVLIKLKTPIKFNEYQQPIEIQKETPNIGENVTVMGFGYHHHLVEGVSLRVAQTSIIKDEECLKSYEQKYTKNMICTSVSRIDLCFGDSGGPAIHNNKYIGVISQGCEYTKPNIFTKVALYYDWIMQTTGIKYSDS